MMEMSKAAYRKQRAVQRTSTPPTEEDMQRYYNMLKPRTVLNIDDSVKLDKAMAEANPLTKEYVNQMNENYSQLIKVIK